MPDGSSLQRTDEFAKKVRGILQSTPGVDIVGTITGFNFLTYAAQSNAAVLFAILKPWDERPPEQSAPNLVNALRMKLLSLPDGVALSFDPPSIPGMGSTGGFEFQVEDLTGRGSAALNDAMQAVLAEARKQPELNAQGLFSTFSNSTPQFKYDLDRNKAKLLGLNLAGCVQHASDIFGLALRERLQSVRPHLPCHHAGGKGRAAVWRPTSPSCTSAMRQVAWLPLSTLGSLKPWSVRRPSRTTQLRLRAHQRRRKRRASARARRSLRWSARLKPRCRAISALNGRASRSRS